MLEADHAERSIRVRVHVVRYDVQRRSRPPLPRSDGFFLMFPWESAADGDPIRDADSPAQAQDDDWVARNVRRFVESARACHLQPASLHETEFDLLDGDFHHERDGAWSHDFRFAQADFRVQVTEMRCSTWRPGRCWAAHRGTRPPSTCASRPVSG